MTDNKAAPVVDGSFSTFMFGLTVGAIGALLLSTEEGRKLARQALDAASENLGKAISLPEEVEGSSATSAETPPPPPPYLPHTKATPSYFHSTRGRSDS